MPDACRLKPALQIASPAAEIDSANYHFAIAGIYQRVHFADDLVHRERAALAANIRDDAERAAIVASVLHFEVGPGTLVFIWTRCLENGRCEEFGVGEDVGDENRPFVVGRWSLA